MTATSVLVVGGGIAGTAAALGLDKAGFDVTVLESHPDAAEDLGAFLTLASNGMRALAQLGATDAVTAVGFPLTSLRLLDSQGAELTQAPLGEADDPALRFRCLRRGELNSALQAEAVRRGIPVRHGTRLVSVAHGPDSVTARLSDGDTVTADLLIGADGLNSTVRRHVLGSAPQPRYAGQRVFYGYTHEAPVTDGTGVITMVRGSGAAFGYASSPAGETYWFARVAGDPLPADGPAYRMAADLRDELLTVLRKDSTPAADIVAARADRIMVTNATEMPLGTPWHSGRVLIVGDAAHAASPATGQGASMALEDAVVLAKSLRDTPDPHRAFAVHERYRRPRVEHNITVSGGISRGTRTPSRDAAANPGARREDDALIRQLAWDVPLETAADGPD
ncbi:2-polyprenyl-6-methoxyphenol hydroxylase-like FAD-dependent oxidoreductase [Streptomyces griseochromogenes]|uniref:2-polyprenyl-6-methoxyphenol hydroxylase-like FAD-dependent oxidoreductase n=1 Tax=Streptomyces griseochromogenes TaxID=68214 RepID=A0A1B1AXQ7_9ACTN|nr:FAD-dependent oxidoreductase [Streptomyces griseochromogenes]ANP51317.1 monooxygenase [Streptomyces griseochromogenes]MBP2049983.1 2-polyprenyl-6-methoxyphenol hydroxylase-like FAD-dependent oxidoreductase [Streptomyces griseochromogenes]